MRKPLIAGNLKMHKTIKESIDYAKGLIAVTQDVQDKDILICPPFTVLSEVAKVLKGSSISLGGQNMYYETKGAFTGEVSGEMLLDAGCEYVILGHSERRHIFREEDELINLKVKKALNLGLKPILCVGELLEEREAGITESIVKNQIEHNLEDVKEDEIPKVTIAYEPVWAIGTGKTAEPKDAEEVHLFIRKLIEHLYSEELAKNIRILYGGSVKPDNISSLMSMPNLDGALVGGACLEVDSFCKIIKFMGCSLKNS